MAPYMMEMLGEETEAEKALLKEMAEIVDSLVVPADVMDKILSYAGEEQQQEEPYERAIFRDFMDNFHGMSRENVETVYLDLTDAKEEENPPNGNVFDEDALFGFSNQTLADQPSEENIQNDNRNIVEQTEDGFATPAPAEERPEDLFESLIHNKLREPDPDEDWDDPEPIKLRLRPGTMQYVAEEKQTPPDVQEGKSKKGKKKKKKKKRVEEEEVSLEVLQEEIGDAAVPNVVKTLMESGELQVTKKIVPVPEDPQNISEEKIILEEAQVEVSEKEAKETTIIIEEKQDVSPPIELLDNPQEQNMALEDDMNKAPAAAVEEQEKPKEDPTVVEVAEILLKMLNGAAVGSNEQDNQPPAEKLPDVQSEAEQKVVPVAVEKVPDEAQTKKGKKKNKKEKEQIPQAEVERNKENLLKEKGLPGLGKEDNVLEEQGHAIDITDHFYKFDFEKGLEKVSHFPLNQKEKETDEWECLAPVSLPYVPEVRRFLDLEKNPKYKKEEPKMKVQTLADVTNSKKNKPMKKKTHSKSEISIVNLPMNVVEEKSAVQSDQPDPIVVLKPIEEPSASEEQKKEKNDSANLENIPRKEVPTPEKIRSVEKAPPVQFPPESVVTSVQPDPIVEKTVVKPAIEGPSAQDEFRAPAEKKEDKNDTVILENIPRKEVPIPEKIKSVEKPPPVQFPPESVVTSVQPDPTVEGPSAQGESRAPVEQKKDAVKWEDIPRKVPIPEKKKTVRFLDPVHFPPLPVVKSVQPAPIVEKRVLKPAIKGPSAQGEFKAPVEQKKDKNDSVNLENIPRKAVPIPEKTKPVEKSFPAQLPPESVVESARPAPMVILKRVLNPAIEGPSAQGEFKAPAEKKEDKNDTVILENIPRKEMPISERIQSVEKPPPVQFLPESVVTSVQPAPIVEKRLVKPAIQGPSAQDEFRAPVEQKTEKNDTDKIRIIQGKEVPIPEKIKSEEKAPPVQVPPESVVKIVQPDPIVIEKKVVKPTQGEFKAKMEEKKKDKNDTVILENIPRKEVPISEKIKSVEKPPPVQLPPELVVTSVQPDPTVEKTVVKPAIQGPSAQDVFRAPVEQKTDRNDSVDLENIPRKTVQILEKTKSVEKLPPTQLPPEPVVKSVQPAPIVILKRDLNPAIEGPSAQGKFKAPAEKKEDKNDTVILENNPRKEVPIPERIKSVEKAPPVQVPPESVVTSVQPAPIFENRYLKPAFQGQSAQGEFRMYRLLGTTNQHDLQSSFRQDRVMKVINMGKQTMFGLLCVLWGEVRKGSNGPYKIG
ncbi:titin-like [Cloeon dipterum]|uniref:titin-like n=1 Tax=Cloeon dipterum TaxID=197152 RepID=UPI0032203172